MIALPARSRKRLLAARRRKKRGACGPFSAAHGLTNMSAKIIMPPHLRPAHAPEDCDKEAS